MSERTIRTLGWVVTAAAVAIYAYMMSVTLPHLAEMSGGLTVFDLRAGGYDFETARTLIANLGIDGRQYYQGVQHLLDSIYPPLLALTVIFWMWRFAPRWRAVGWPLPNPVLWTLMGIAALAAVFDLIENAMVGQMLSLGAEGLTADMVATASGFTLAKSIAVSISQVALLVLILGPLVRKPLARRR